MKNELKTPAWIDFLVDNLAPHEVAEEIRGDLYELLIKDIATAGLHAAKRRYIVNGLGFLAKEFFWKRSPQYNPNTTIMLSSYFKMAKRSLVAYRGTSIINILGLVIGIASALVLLTVIRFERSFDSFHSQRDRIYRIVRVSGSDMSEFRTGVSYPVPGAVREGLTSIDNLTAMEYFGGANIDIVDATGTTVRKFREESGCALVEPEFFQIFDFRDTNFKWIAGNPDKALDEPFNVVITKTIAKKYFGDGEPLGQTLRFQKQWDCKVTGVVEDLPPNTDFPITTFISYSTLNILAGKEGIANWYGVNDSHNAFVVLKGGTTKAEAERQIAAVHAAHTPKELHESRHYLLQELGDMHYDAKFGNYNGRTISRQTILSLALIAVFLLLTAGINYINLATAQSTLRAKEIGLRKVMGSNQKNLVIQFLMETFLVVLIAGIIGLGLSEILIINLQSLVNIKLVHLNFTDPFILISTSAIVLFVTLFSGLYPSLNISRFNPVTAMKNRFSTENVGGFSLRKVLVVVQFTITQILVVATFIVVSQMKFFRQVDMGFTRDAIITARIPDRDPNKLQVLENQLRSLPCVAGVSVSFTLPSGVSRNRSYRDIGPADAASMGDYQVFEFQSIDSSYLHLYKIRLIAGRNLNMQDSIGNILINKTLVKNLSLGLPADAIGTELKIGGTNVKVVGVVDDFFSNSLKETVDNMVMTVEPKAYSTLSVKLNVTDHASSLPDAVRDIEKIWTSNFPDFIFNYRFFDDNINAFYEQEEKYARLFQLFSLVFLLIGCLGLYGLITFVVNRKSKEVAIRKVLGASIRNILVMFSKEYVQLILLSFLIAAPVTYYAVDSWLSNFAHHIELQWWLFAVPGLLVLVIALLVVTAKSIRTANANPVDKLKYE